MDSIESQSSGDTRESVSAVNGNETLPCGNRDAQPLSHNTTVNDTNVTPQTTDTPAAGYHWTLNNWGVAQMSRNRNNSATVRVDLASPEDISLDTDSTRVVFSAYGTTV